MKKDTDNKRLVLSPTRMSAFLSCRLRYKYLYIDKIGKFYYRPNPWNAFGGTMHRVLELLHRPGIEEMSEKELVNSYNSSWVSVGYASPEEEDLFRRKGEDILRRYHSAATASGAKTILTEKQVKWDMGDFILAGRLDRLDMHKDGSLEIVDYKSGLTSITEEEVKEHLAMSLYQVIVSHLHPDKRVFASIYCLSGGVKVSAELSPEERAAVEESAKETAQSIMGAQEYPPHRSAACEDCDFYRLCVKQPWFESEEYL